MPDSIINFLTIEPPFQYSLTCKKRRSYCSAEAHWSREFSKGLLSGQEYEDTPNVIAINIVGYEFLPQVVDFHTIFHIWEDTHRDIMLTDALEIHFVDMVKFQSLSAWDIRNDPLSRWLTYLDQESPQDLIEEVLKMDIAIKKADEKMTFVSSDDDALRLYEKKLK